jgi:hypothetical protein
MSKDIIWNTGREFGENIHPELKTFSVVVSSEMTPGFHIIVYAAVGTGNTKEIVAGSSNNKPIQVETRGRQTDRKIDRQTERQASIKRQARQTNS